MKFKDMNQELLEPDYDILSDFQIFRVHQDLRHRIKKTLYYGKLPNSPRSSLPLTEATVDLFAKAVPKGRLGIVDMHFAASVSRRACISPCSLMLALVYLEQLKHKNPDYLRTVSSCDLFLVSMMVASKYLFDNGEDEEVFNDEWASSANMEAKELSLLEREFLAAMNWELFVKPETFYETLDNIEARIAKQEGNKRGWLSYTDAEKLTTNFILTRFFNIVVEDVFKVILVSAIAYVSAIVTLGTSFALSQQCSLLMSKSLQSNTLNTAQNASYYFNRQTNHHNSQNSIREWVENQEEPTVTSNLLNEESLVNSPDVFANKTFVSSSIALWQLSIERLKMFLENPGGFARKKQFSLWNTFQYWPSCCGATTNSFLF